MRKEAKHALNELEDVLQELACTPRSFAFMDLWRTAQQLYAQKEYGLVCGLCSMATNRLVQLTQDE